MKVTFEIPDKLYADYCIFLEQEHSDCGGCQASPEKFLVGFMRELLLDNRRTKLVKTRLRDLAKDQNSNSVDVLKRIIGLVDPLTAEDHETLKQQSAEYDE